MEKESITVAKTFAKRLKSIRQQKGWSQGQLAKKVGADVQRISKYERGLICPNAEMLVKIANAFQINVDYILRGEKIDISQLHNQELLKRFEEINQLSETDQNLLISIMDAFIKKHRFEEFVVKMA